MIASLPLRIAAAAAVLVLLLVGVVLRENAARAAGREVLLPMEAVDPRDLLTGHYVALRLSQQLALGLSCPHERTSFEEGGWIGLKPAGGHYRFVGVGASRQAALAGGAQLAVRGGVYCSRTTFGDAEADVVTLDIGVDRFHADQDEALAIEKALRQRRQGEAPAFAVVSVGDDGRARLKGVIVDGKRTDLTWW
ncbi:GDYXXLXY domain-containing protein [Phenylobacterium sp. NIBR 498073]|uniref:GDYXXLXY domain-containing protein n=1 Tax=Phenylobacterium sp. NIBR 498073 TaxID=3015177 RepID=UPI0022B480DB|nr:GDYXXLXY domain-containing protein [Phenylobacterium sp. NIBR 498073]WGU40757.1 GDYXXLXY domain-containing protein [Phenylobacterium sp. NIBR 498073]